VIAGIGLAIRLGFWQIDRNAQRQAKVNQIQAIQSMPVLDLDQLPIPQGIEDMEYRQVVATGKFDFEHQVALRNQVRSRMTGTDPGYALVTPLVLSNGWVVLVERGWIPMEYDSPDAWAQFDEPGTIKVDGFIRKSMEKGELGSTLVDPTLSPGQEKLDFWNYINLPRMQEQLPYELLPIYIQQASSENQEELPYPLAVEPDLDPGAHLGFAMQWFFYAGLLLIGYPIWLKKQNKKASPEKTDR